VGRHPRESERRFGAGSGRIQLADHLVVHINEDGSPHVTGVGALWVDGTFWFETGKDTRKARNVARDPRCSIAVSIRDAMSSSRCSGAGDRAS